MSKIRHIGFIKDTRPEPTIYYGSIAGAVDVVGISRRAIYLILDGHRKKTRTGWRKMMDEEYEKYYQPPTPPKKARISKEGDRKMRHWKVLFIKDYEGGKAPKDPSRRFSGSPSEMAKFSGLSYVLLRRLVLTKIGECPETEIPLRSLQGWKVVRVKKRDSPKPERERVWCPEKKKLVTVHKHIPNWKWKNRPSLDEKGVWRNPDGTIAKDYDPEESFKRVKKDE